MFLAIDRVSKFTYVEFHEHAGNMEGAAFLGNVVAAFPGKKPRLLQPSCGAIITSYPSC